MGKPAPLSPLGRTVKRLLSCSTPHIFVAGSVSSLDVEYLTQTSVNPILDIPDSDHLALWSVLL